MLAIRRRRCSPAACSARMRNAKTCAHRVDCPACDRWAKPADVVRFAQGHRRTSAAVMPNRGCDRRTWHAANPPTARPARPYCSVHGFVERCQVGENGHSIAGTAFWPRRSKCWSRVLVKRFSTGPTSQKRSEAIYTLRSFFSTKAWLAHRRNRILWHRIVAEDELYAAAISSTVRNLNPVTDRH